MSTCVRYSAHKYSRPRYVTDPTGASHVEKPEEIHDARRAFDRLRSEALSPSDSAAFIERIAAGL